MTNHIISVSKKPFLDILKEMLPISKNRRKRGEFAYSDQSGLISKTHEKLYGHI